MELFPKIFSEEEIKEMLSEISEEELKEAKKRMLLPTKDIIMHHAEPGTPHVWDIKGKKYLDFTSQAWTLNLGWSYPDIVYAAAYQASILNHIRNQYPNISRLKLIKKLTDLAPGNLKKVVLSTQGGSIANEIAMKIAMVNKPKDYVFVTTWGGYHGTTLATFSASHYIPYVIRFQEFAMDRFAKVPYPYCYRCPFGYEGPEECNLECLNMMEKTINYGVNAPVNSVIIEPFQGAGGNIPAPKRYIKELRKMCNENDVFLIFDEAQTALGRIGTMFAAEYYKTIPDIMSLTKSLGGGFPIGATLAREDMDTFTPGEQHSTFSANPVSFAAALMYLHLIEKLNLPQRSMEMGEFFFKRLYEMQEKYEIIGDIRGSGLFIGVEFVEDRKTKYPATDETEEIVERCLKKGLIIDAEAPYITRSGDIRRNVIPIKPPLIISKEDAEQGLDILEGVIKEVSDEFEIPYSNG